MQELTDQEGAQQAALRSRRQEFVMRQASCLGLWKDHPLSSPSPRPSTALGWRRQAPSRTGPPWPVWEPVLGRHRATHGG